MNTRVPTLYHPFGGAVCTAAVLLLACVASAQNLYVANGGLGDIIEITPGGVESTFASGLDNPNAVAFDSAGNLFEADYGTGDIYEFANVDGALSTSPTVFASNLENPLAIAFNSAGDLFVSSHANNSIVEITPGGVESTFIFQLSSPYRMAFDGAGDLFVAGDDSGNIYEFANVGGTLNSSPTIFASGLADPRGLAFNSAGDLFEADYESGRIFEFTPGGVQSTYASGLNDPFGLAFDSTGDLFVASGNTADDDSIIEITPKGASTFASGLAPIGMAFQGVTLPVPEPSLFGLLAVAGSASLVFRRRLRRGQCAAKTARQM